MMKKPVKIVAALVVALLIAAGAFGCADGLKKASKNANKYTIDATYDSAAHAVTAGYKLSYINNSGDPLDYLMLHLYPNAYREGAKYPAVPANQIGKAYPAGASYGGIAVSGVKINGKAAQYDIEGQDSDILRVAFAAQLYPSARFTVTCDFVTTLAQVNHRLGYNAATVNLGNWYPIACVYENGAYSASPYYSTGDCFYSDIADYDVNFKAADGTVVASTGAAKAGKSENGYRSYSIKAAAVRDFALVLSNQFQTVSQKAGGTTVTYYYYDDADPARSLKTAVDSLNTFNSAFGKYPYSTLAVVKTAFLHGGMEYPNLVYISDAVDADYFQEVIVHEIAHQWWYGLVGNDEVAAPWMDEGLADYSVTIFYDKNPSYGATRADRIGDALKGYILYVDIYQNLTGQVDTSMNRATNKYRDEYEYVYMVYVKGQLLFDNLRSTVGDGAFYKGLKNYFGACKFTNAAPADMIGAFSGAAGTDLTSFFNSWLEGKIYIADLYGASGGASKADALPEPDMI